MNLGSTKALTDSLSDMQKAKQGILGWRYKKKWMMLLLMFTGVCYIIYRNFDKDAALGVILLRPWSGEVCVMAVEQKRRLAATVADVYREIHKLAGNGGNIDAKWAVKLAGVIEELDPRIEVDDTSWYDSTHIPSIHKKSELSNRDRHVCPEVNFGHSYDVPYCQHGIEQEPCSYVPKFKDVLTAILPALSWHSNTVRSVVQQIRKLYYDIPITVIVPLEQEIDSALEVTVMRFEKDIEDSDIMNRAVKTVNTPYVFLGLSMINFNNQSSLERLVRVIDELKHVKVAAGAARDLQGVWQHGCLQQRMADYEARYTSGYYYSKHECMYCDDLTNPFVTTSEQLAVTPFTSGLSGPTMYRDWFANIRASGVLTLACPDVMFYTNQHNNMREKDWLAMGKQWSLEKIHSYDDHIYSFSCESVGISCVFPLNIVFSYLLPPCCRAMIEKELGNIVNYGEKNNMFYELNWGNVLAAVKMGGQIPWDFDGDMRFKCKDYEKWLLFTETPEGKQCSLSIHKQQIYFTIHCPNFFIDMICNDFDKASPDYLPESYRDIPTTINYSGRYMAVRANPGLFARSCIGVGDLKHIPHSRTKKKLISSKNKNKDEKENPWNYCPHPEHHSCLIHYPADGNLPFTQPFLHL